MIHCWPLEACVPIGSEECMSVIAGKQEQMRTRAMFQSKDSPGSSHILKGV